MKDVVVANTLFAEGEASGVFNVGFGENISIKTGQRYYGDDRQGWKANSWRCETRGYKTQFADISKAKSVGYNPRYNLKKGLTETVRGFSHIF